MAAQTHSERICRNQEGIERMSKSNGTKLRPFQIKGVRAINHYKGTVLLADEMGLGKTIQALWWLKEHPDARPAVIVTPAHLKGYWEEEARSKLGMRTTVLEGMRPKRMRLKIHPILILNYDILKGWIKVIQEIEPKCLIIDEAHYCKNPRTKRTKHVRSLAKIAKHRMALSGTPLLNRPSELFPTLNI